MRTLIDLTDRFPMRFDVAALLADIARIEGQTDWLGHYDPTMTRGWQAIPLVSLGGRMNNAEAQRPLPLARYHEYSETPIVAALPAFKAILDAFQCPKGRTRILKLLPGAGIGKHRDIRNEVACFAFDQVRLHIPIITNPKVTFFVGRERIRMQEGRLYYVNFTKTHWVKNEGDHARIHLVIDVGVNDWLRGIFPDLSAWERLENAVARRALPWVWQAQKRAYAGRNAAYQAYRHSPLHSVVHRLKGA